MIPGNWYKGADLQFILYTEINLTGAISLAIRVEFTVNGISGALVKDYTGAISNISGVAATVPAADNIYPGLMTLRVMATLPSVGAKPGDPETVFILDIPAVTP